MLERILILLLLFVASSLRASVHLAHSCPDYYEGRVISILEIDKTDHIMAKDLIRLEVENSNSSEPFIEFKYLRHAMQKIKENQLYKIGMRKGKLCLVEEIH